MKVTELMIGDWVSYNGHPVLVEALNKSNGYAIEKDMISIKLNNDTCLGINAERLEPLPLTIEILEKNGFVGKIAISGSFIYFYPLNDKVYWYKNEIYAIGKNVWQDIYLTNCKYIHRFQHILKDLQIEKEVII